MHELAVESAKLAIMPMSGVIDYFLGSLKSASTAKTYNSTLKTFFNWVKKDFKSVTPFDAIEFNTYLKAEYAEATVQNRISTLNEFFKFCKEVGLIDKNPFAVIKQSAAPNKSGERFLTTKELDKLLAELKKTGKREYLLGLVLAYTGMRISEAQGLSWSDVTEMPNGDIYLNILRKGNKRKMLYLRPDVARELIEYMDRPLNQFDRSPIWLNPSKNRVSAVSMRNWVIEAGKRAGIKKHCNPHILRHTFVSQCLANKADLRAVQKYVDHASIKTTERYYHTTEDKVSDFMPK